MWKHAFFICVCFGYIMFGKSVDKVSEGENEGEGEDENAYDRILNINEKSSNEWVEKEVFQGDILISKGNPMYRVIHESDGNSEEKRNAHRERRYLWREKIVPYVIDNTFDQSAAGVVKKAMQAIQNKTCISFVPHTNQDNWIKFVGGKECMSGIGRNYWRKGSQEIILAAGCIHEGTIIHEVLHALGFWHEQSRPDRDDYVEIFWENIKEGNAYNFKKYSWTDVDTLQKQYDYKSIMHYGKYAFTKKRGVPTMVPRQDKSAKLGQRDGLSNGDIEELNVLYDCKSDNVDFFSQWSTFSPCVIKEKVCIKKKERFCTHADLKKCPGADIFGIHEEKVNCTDKECYAPVNGHWGRWTSWTQCSVSCENGTKTRTRKCDNPAKKYNGLDCPGSSKAAVVCTRQPCSIGANDCQFEHGMCKWYAETGQKYHWSLHKKNTPSKNTGPSFDHTTQTPKGHYVYAEASRIAVGDVTTLSSDKFDATKGMCLSFWYHMYGRGMGTLYVTMTEWGKLGFPESTLWNVFGNQGNTWLYKELDLKSLNGKFSVRFMAERGTSYLSDIALDDIYFKNHTCKPAPVDGKWGDWSSWSTCSKSCGENSVKERTRKCNSPSPQFGGLNCTGSNKSTEICKTTPCKAKAIGCFADLGGRRERRPFLHMKSFRLQIDWWNMDVVVNLCENYVKRKGFRVFGIEYYGECWYGTKEKGSYAKDGVSKNCYLDKVGADHALMVYSI